MPRYRIENFSEEAAYIVDAPNTQDACEILGWQINTCDVSVVSTTEIIVGNPTIAPIRVSPQKSKLSNPKNQKLLDKLLASDNGVDHSTTLNDPRAESFTFLHDHSFAD